MKISKELVLLASVFLTTGAHAEIRTYYVGRDGAEVLTFGIYQGKPNPNFGRLNFLIAHPNLENVFNNHYHGIGSWSFTGSAENPVESPTNANNRIPETYTGQPGLTLVPGDGLYAGKLVSAKTEEHYSDLTIQSVHNLLKHQAGDQVHEFGWGSGEYTMFHSSGGSRTASLEGTIVAMELVEISDGLHIGSSTELDVLNAPGDRVILGDGQTFSWTPVVWAEADTAPGTLSFSFKLVDVGNSDGHTPLLESGTAHMDFRVPSEAEIQIEATVTLSMPLVHVGQVLYQSDSVDGPWVPVQGGMLNTGVSSKSLTLPLHETSGFFRLAPPVAE